MPDAEGVVIRMSEATLGRMWATVFPRQPFPGADEASQMIEDFLAATIEWQGKMQHAHDLLEIVMRNNDAHKLMPALRRGLQDSFDTLCWVLGHQNHAFEKTLVVVDAVLNGVGARLPAAEES